MPKSLVILGALLCCVATLCSQESSKIPDTQEKPRVFITNSESWSVSGGGGGNSNGFGGGMAGGARPQTAEIIKTFGERCPQVLVNNISEKADYVVILDHEGGKGALRHKNKVAVFARISGDSIVSKSTLSLGGSVQDACEAINKDWTVHGEALRTGALSARDKPAGTPQPASAPSAAPSAPSSGRVSVTSVPDGADIEIDGSFVGNTPSDTQLAEGEHVVSVKKTGFSAWERKLKVTGGSAIHLNAELEKAVSQ